MFPSPDFFKTWQEWALAVKAEWMRDVGVAEAGESESSDAVLGDNVYYTENSVNYLIENNMVLNQVNGPNTIPDWNFVQTYTSQSFGAYGTGEWWEVTAGTAPSIVNLGEGSTPSIQFNATGEIRSTYFIPVHAAASMFWGWKYYTTSTFAGALRFYLDRYDANKNYLGTHLVQTASGADDIWNVYDAEVNIFASTYYVKPRFGTFSMTAGQATVNWVWLGEQEKRAQVGAIGSIPPSIRGGEGATSIIMTPNATIGGGPDDGEIRLQPGTFWLGDGTSRTITADSVVTTFWEGSSRPLDYTFYLISSATTPTARFGGSNWGTVTSSTGWFCAVYNRQEDQFYAVDNLNNQYAFTPLDTDFVVAIGYKSATSGGIGIFNVVVASSGDLGQQDSVTPGQIDPNAVTETTIADNAISSPKLQANSVIAAKIAANQIGTDHLQANSISSDKIQADAVTASHILADTITANEIFANTITSAEIELDGVTKMAHASAGTVSWNAPTDTLLLSANLDIGTGTANKEVILIYTCDVDVRSPYIGFNDGSGLLFPEAESPRVDSTWSFKRSGSLLTSSGRTFPMTGSNSADQTSGGMDMGVQAVNYYIASDQDHNTTSATPILGWAQTGTYQRTWAYPQPWISYNAGVFTLTGPGIYEVSCQMFITHQSGGAFLIYHVYMEDDMDGTYGVTPGTYRDSVNEDMVHSWNTLYKVASSTSRHFKFTIHNLFDTSNDPLVRGNSALLTVKKIGGKDTGQRRYNGENTLIYRVPSAQLNSGVNTFQVYAARSPTAPATQIAWATVQDFVCLLRKV